MWERELKKGEGGARSACRRWRWKRKGRRRIFRVGVVRQRQVLVDVMNKVKVDLPCLWKGGGGARKRGMREVLAEDWATCDVSHFVLPDNCRQESHLLCACVTSL